MEVIETCEKAGIMHDVGAVFSYLHEFEEKEEYMKNVIIRIISGKMLKFT